MSTTLQTTDFDEHFVKTYNNKKYRYPVNIRHQGKVIAFAMDDTRRIYYTVLDMNQQLDTTIDVHYWNDTPRQLYFPNEIAEVGYSLIANTPIPQVKRNSHQEAGDKDRLTAKEMDIFLSTTARLTADVPFQVFSDGQYIFLFRQSLNKNHEDMVYKLTNGKSSRDTSRNDLQKSGANNVPLVNNTLLADRFVLGGNALKNVREIRYRRNRHKTIPKGTKDNLGATDMENRPFYEPTYELNFIDQLEGGRFNILQLPTKIAEVKRWQIFAYNSGTERIHSYNFERSEEGLFDTRGTRFYTSPDPTYRKSVFEKQPGTCPFTKQALVPVEQSSDHAETCLQFNGTNDHVEIANMSNTLRNAFTLEAWVWLDGDTPASECRTAVCSKKHGNNTAAFLYVHGSDHKLGGGFFDGAWRVTEDDQSLPINTWVHIAVSYDQKKIILYKNGEKIKETTYTGNIPTEDEIWYIGRSSNNAGTPYWKGKIDEVRVWNRAVSEADIKVYKSQRLTGNEPGLIGYWSFDEGNGTSVYDQTSYGRNGSLQGNPVWSVSTAPVGDSPGMRRTSFGVNNRKVHGGLSALVYYQQGKIQTSQGSKSVKKQARVMLSIPTKPSKATVTDQKPYISVLDFGVSREGRLALTPDTLTLPEINDTSAAKIEEIAVLEAQLAMLKKENEQPDPQLAIPNFTDYETDANLAYATDISEDYAIVGATNKNEGGKNAGAAYIFKRTSGNTWGTPVKLTISDGNIDTRFGQSVAIFGDYAIVGAPNKNEDGKYIGVVYVFKRTGDNTWSTPVKLIDPDLEIGANFGNSVATSGDYVIVGASYKYEGGKSLAGAVYVFKRTGDNSWGTPVKLTNFDVQVGAFFGSSVAISGNYVIVGAENKNEGGEIHAGAAYIFKRTGDNNWGTPVKLTTSDDAESSAHFGSSVAISKSYAIVGANRKDNSAGAAYVFRRTGDNSWGTPVKLTASNDTQLMAAFGYSVAISEHYIIVGAMLKDEGADKKDAGAIYIFKNIGLNNWSKPKKLLANDSCANAWFGDSVAISGNHAFVGAPYKTENGKTGAGKVYSIFLNAKDTEIQNLQEQVIQKTNGLEGGSTSLFGRLHTDPSGLTVSGALLKFAYTDTAPILFDRSDGNLSLYFKGSNQQFFSAYYNPQAMATRFSLNTEIGSTIYLQARNADAGMNTATITIEDGPTASTCKVTLNGSGITEVWNHVPRQASQLVKVINGEAVVPEFLGTLKTALSGTVTVIEFTNGIGQAITSGNLLRIGEHVLTVSADVAKGATNVSINNVSLTATANATVYSITYDYTQAIVTPEAFSLQKGSLLFRAFADKATALVSNGNGTKTQNGISGVWVGESPGKAIRFDGFKDYLALPAAKKHQMDITSDATLETWIKPDKISGISRIIHHHTTGSKYTLGIHALSTNNNAITLNGIDDCIEIPYINLGGNEITIEYWFKGTKVQSAVRMQDNNNNYIIAGWGGSGPKHFLSNEGGEGYNGLSCGNVQDENWHHVAMTWKKGATKGFVSYLDGEVVAQKNAVNIAIPSMTSETKIYLGSYNGTSEFTNGALAEVRIWNKARTTAQIRAYKDNTLSGVESGLVGYWRLDGGQIKDYSTNNCHGILKGTGYKILIPSPITSFRYRPFAMINGQTLMAEQSTVFEKWQHLAATYNQSYALQFDGNGDQLQAKHNKVLNIADDLTLEIVIKVDRTDRRQLLIAKGDPNKDTGIPYYLELTPGGGVRFVQESTTGSIKELAVASCITAGNIHKIAVIRRKRNDTNNMGNAGMSGKNDVTNLTTGEDYNDGNIIKTVENAMRDDYISGKKKRKNQLKNKRGSAIPPTDFANFTTGMMASTTEIELYIDYKQVAATTMDPSVAAGGNSKPLSIGGDNGGYFKGVISEIALWNTARTLDRLHLPPEESEYGMTSWWRMEENRGNVATDSRSGNHAVIFGATWIKNPDLLASPLKLYQNGTTLKAKPLSATHPLVTASWGDEQFTLGACRNGTNITEPFKGSMEEVRIWKEVRTQEQLLDNAFTRLKESKQNLLANYTFDYNKDNEIKDSSLLLNHLVLDTGDSKPIEILSTAPISNDTAAVRSALAGVSTSFHHTIDSSPAIAEYGDSQLDAEGNFSGAMKRCYGYIKNDCWYLVTGYKVGNLVREWVGQAQFAPQVIGFIEGAPPVPSENMTYGAYESDGSKVTLTQAEEVTYTYASSKENSYRSSLELSGKGGGKFKIDVLTAPLGFGISTPLEIDGFMKGKVNFESEGSYMSEQGHSAGRNRSRSLDVSLGGNWEDPNTNKQLNSYLGRRWNAANMGSALVQSETADVYILRLAHNNAFVAYSFQPNPDIPKDWNLISFPLNPRYVKQGTLDGKVGYNEAGNVVEDPDYKNIARSYGEHSYFKPKEAYMLKKQIEAEEQRLQAYYMNFEASPVGGLFANTIKDSSKLMGGVMGSAASLAVLQATPLGPIASIAAAGMSAYTTFQGLGQALGNNVTLARKFSKRNLVNTYVWTADGGFYAETTETTDVVQESATGKINFSAGFSGGGGLKIDSPFSFEFEANAGMSAKVVNTRTKKKEASKSFSLEVNINPSGDMQSKNPTDGEGVYVDGKPKNVHGRVDAYRFMTFYLDSSRDNFDELFNKVIDPIWLEQSSSPFAMAMRQAKQVNKKPACWRVLHRVTFVSRVLPKFSADAPSSLAKTMKVHNISSNWQLIKKIEPFVKDKTGDTLAFTEAVYSAVENYLPELIPYKTEIVQYMKLYFGMDAS